MTLEYFMDECTIWEVNDVIDNIPQTDRNLWSSQRMIAYLLGKANFKGINKEKDICEFAWDKETAGNIEITNEEKADAIRFAKQIHLIPEDADL